MKSKILIVNADDFGQSKGINQGIIECYEKGIVTSASLMVRYDAVLEAVSYSKNNPGLGVGLHIDLGEWIYAGGNWDPLYEVVSLNDENAVQEEIIKQIESFTRIMGRKPTHIDSHQHVHQQESIRPILVEIATNLNITLRGCSQKVKYCGDFYGQCLDGSPYHESISVSSLHNIISHLEEGITEMACHPALFTDIETMYKIEREMEVNTLCDKSNKEAIRNSNVELCSFEGILF